MEPSAKLMTDKGLSMSRCFLPIECLGAQSDVLITNFTRHGRKLYENTTIATADFAGDPEVHAVTPTDSSTGARFHRDFSTRIDDGILGDERTKLVALLESFSDCFATSNGDLGSCTVVQHTINTGNAVPYRHPPYPSAWKQREVIQKQVEKMMKDGRVTRTRNGDVVVESNRIKIASDGVNRSLTMVKTTMED